MVKNTIDFISGLFGILLFILAIINAFALLFATMNRYSFIDHCEEPKKRVDYILPGKALGCWLGEVPNDPRNEKKPYILKYVK